MKLHFREKTKFGMEFQYKNRGFDLKKNFEIEPLLGMGIRMGATCDIQLPSLLNH